MTSHSIAPDKATSPVDGNRWKAAHADLYAEIKTRHYSPKTLKAYAAWIRKFQGFTKGKEPDALSSSDVKEYMRFLAIKQKVSASTQNQAFNALLFFYRNILKRELGDLKDSVRAKRKPSIPVVLSREEIDTLLARLSYPYDLVVKLLYGCGLRLSECLNLRLRSFRNQGNIDGTIFMRHMCRRRLSVP